MMRDLISEQDNGFKHGVTLIFLFLLVVGIGIAFGNGLDIGFLFDGGSGILRNPAIRSLHNIPSFFTDPHAIWANPTQVDLRPFLLITFAVNYAISGLEPWSYHLFNLLLHFTGSVLVFYIVRDYLWWPVSTRGSSGEARYPAAAAALFFALAPLNNQPVNYVWARSSLLCVTLYLGAFLLFIRSRWGWGALLYALALLTKAIAVTLPATLLLYDYLYRDREEHPRLTAYLRDWKRLVSLILLPTILAVSYVLYRAVVLPEWTEEARHASGVTPWIWFMSQWSALLYYVKLFLWPQNLSIDHDFPYTLTFAAIRAKGSLLVILTWVGLALKLAKRYPQFAFATLWFFITLAPVSSFAPLAEVINEHRPYVATSLGLSVLLSWGLYQLSAVIAPRRRDMTFSVVCLLLLFPAVAINHYRTWQWQDELRLWEDTTHKSPKNPRSWMNAGSIYMQKGQFEKARFYFERAKQEGPQYAKVYINLGVLEQAEAHFDKALQNFQEALRLAPNLDESHFYVGKYYENVGEIDKAIEAFKKALSLNLRYAEAQRALANLISSGGERSQEKALMAKGVKALYNDNDLSQAIEKFQAVLKLNPKHYGATYQMAVTLDRLGQSEKAVFYWQSVLKMAKEYGDEETTTKARRRLE